MIFLLSSDISSKSSLGVCQKSMPLAFELRCNGKWVRNEALESINKYDMMLAFLTGKHVV